MTEIDPKDAAAWYWYGATVCDQDDVANSDVRKLAPLQIPIFQKALALDPFNASALYKLAFAYAYIGQIDKQKELLAQWTRIKPDQTGPAPGPGDEVELKYGDMGKYAQVVNPFPALASSAERARGGTAVRGRGALGCEAGGGRALGHARRISPASWHSWGVCRARFGAAVSAFDADGDGKLDLFLAAAVVGPKGVRDVLLLNKGEGRFLDASAAFGLAADRASLGVAAGDFDADRHIDLLLTGVGGNRLLRNVDGKKFEDISGALKPMGAAGRFALGAVAGSRPGRRSGSLCRELLRRRGSRRKL